MTTQLTDAEKAFLTMCKLAGIEIQPLAQHGPTVVTLPGMEIRVEYYDGGQVIMTNFHMWGHRPLLDADTITRIMDTFHKMEPFDFDERFPFLIPLAAIQNNPTRFFPIVASTFEALTIERPELREHYDRARAAWEASQ